jgi:N-acetylglucosamine-6-phosphate deacetylase
MADLMRLGVGGAIVDGRYVSGDVGVSEGLVAAIGLAGGTGTSLAVPGFVDVHTHGYAGVDFVDATPDDHTKVATRITATGVTAYQPTIVSQPLDKVEHAVAQHPGQVANAARVLGFHLEGPFLSPRRAGAHNLEYLESPEGEILRRIEQLPRIHQVTLAPELPGAVAATESLVGRGIVVSLGHSQATPAEVHRAVDAGARAFTHVFNAMQPFSHRNPGIVGVALASEQSFLTGIFDGVHLSEESERILIRCAQDRLVAITDATSAAGKTSGRARLGDTTAAIANGAPRLADGTIAGSVLTMDAAFRRLISLGLSSADAVGATSIAPSRLAQLRHSDGIVVGAPADLVVLDDRYVVRQTLVGGIEAFRS